jgi:predicted O-methyltransferase YrrM
MAGDGTIILAMIRLPGVVEDVLQTGQISLRNGERIAAHSYIPRDECELLHRMAREVGATSAVEVGMAFGVSTVVLADAIASNAARSGVEPKVVAIDPHQSLRDGWQDLGLLQLERAGLRHVVEFHGRPSQDVLPELARSGFRCLLGFVDGWHTFDHTLVDFFYLDRLLQPGGIIVFDDVGYPAVNAVLRFILSNREYEIVERLRSPHRAHASLRLRRAAKRRLRWLARTDRDPSPSHAELFRLLEEVHSVAVRKGHDDPRPFDHYAPF